ncbi:MAG: Uma2 family endonuclease [Hyphomicrobiaceae bacterium]|nr:Uma2 family endonuclease [Hyphomicrobiaceae bacterium]
MPVLKKSEDPPRMKIDEFLEWGETQEGHWELHDGIPVRLHDPLKGHAERISHVEIKLEAVIALRDALKKAGRNCHAVTDGATVRVDDEVSYEPDTLVYCGKRLPPDDIIIPEPVIIVEVLSPSTAYKDVSDKLTDYFKLPSLMHYLIIDPKQKRLQHHFRDGQKVGLSAVEGDKLHLSSPGIDLDLEKLFA